MVGSVSEAKHKIYVINLRSNTVSVINWTDQKMNNTRVGKTPYDIGINNKTNKIYVVNHDDGTVSVINGSTDKKEQDIRIGKDPFSIAINPQTNKIYVTDSGSNTVSVIDGYNNHLIQNIHVGNHPTVLAINPDTNIIYVVNSGSNTVSVIDGSTDKLTAGVTFNVHPTNSGGIWYKKDYPTNTYLYIANGRKCVAKSNKDFEFANCVENLPHNSTIPLNQSAISDSTWNSFLNALGMKPNEVNFRVKGNILHNFLKRDNHYDMRA